MVELKAGTTLQFTGTTGPRVVTLNLRFGDGFRPALAEQLARPYASWRVETTTQTLQLRVTKRGKTLLHRGPAEHAETGDRSHDGHRERLIDPGDPLFSVLGADGAKRRQVDAFLRSLDAVLTRAEKRKLLPDGPLRMVDLGCGNAYLSFAAQRYLSERRPASVTTGIELRADLVERSRARATDAGLSGLTFEVGGIAEADLVEPPHIVLALHACDTATDDALHRAIEWQAPIVLAAPCCHRDIGRQLSAHSSTHLPAPPGYAPLLASPILRERFADLLTDTLRSSLLRQQGYLVEAVEFIDSAHTPRNVMLRAIRTGRVAGAEQQAEYRSLVEQWQVHPKLADLLGT